MEEAEKDGLYSKVASPGRQVAASTDPQASELLDSAGISRVAADNGSTTVKPTPP